jgi:hypothetical protein
MEILQMTTVPLVDFELWRPEYEGHLMTQAQISAHLGWVKATTHKSDEKIGAELGIKKSRTNELLNYTTPELELPYIIKITAHATRQYPDGVPMLVGYKTEARPPKKAVSDAFGPKSPQAVLSALMPKPDPVVINRSDVAIGEVVEPEPIRGLPEEFTREEAVEYVRNLEGKLARADAANRELQSQLQGSRATVTSLGETAASLDAQLKKEQAVVRGLTVQLQESHAAILEQQESLEELQQYREEVRDVLARLYKLFEGRSTEVPE